MATLSAASRASKSLSSSRYPASRFVLLQTQATSIRRKIASPHKSGTEQCPIVRNLTATPKPARAQRDFLCAKTGISRHHLEKPKTIMNNENKTDCIESIVRGFERTSAWRKSISANFNDPRNLRAAETLDKLAVDTAGMTDDQFASVQEHFNWASLPWRNAVSQATRRVERQASVFGQNRLRFCGTACRAWRDRNVTPHTLRHTAATWLMQRAAPMWEAAGFLGMSEKTLRDTYGHHHPDHLKGAAEGIGSRPTPPKRVALVVSLVEERERRAGKPEATCGATLKTTRLSR
jgi:hypothetical protein